ncbi:MAG: 4-oxalocrotonate tautomerase [Marinilabiliales bacterium]|nr:MAG: 4-oxalocrotonate tautomerase [Marinilabiliales bacterium]
MPIIQISITPQTLEKKAELSKTYTDEMHRILDIPKEAITIVFNEMPAESIANGGEMLSERMKRMRK